VVAAKDEEVFGVLDLVCQQQADCLERLLSSVNVVSEEEIIRFGWKAAVLEEAKKIIVLAVDVAADLQHDQSVLSKSLRLRTVDKLWEERGHEPL